MTSAPQQIGPYEIKEFVGRGAMAEIYHGFHPILERHVAVKRMSATDPSWSGQSRVELLQRFFREGKVLARLCHESIVGVYELVAGDHDVYMVLEYVDGLDLRALLRKGGPLPWDVAAMVTRQLAGALQNAHSQDVIHRDIKPANVMISSSGMVKLMDFGLARELKGVEITDTGMMVGTPLFIAPEVLGGHSADGRSDVYALGVLLYQCVAGVNPFANADPKQAMRNVYDGKYRPLRKVVKSVVSPLSKLVDRCIARKPADRYQAAADVRSELDVLLGTHCKWTHYHARLSQFLAERHDGGGGMRLAKQA